MNDAYLVLENGGVFKGKPFGYGGEAVGELVFTTGMTGYLETLSDPVNYGQIVLQTFPLIGNYGVISEDFGAELGHVKAYVVRDWCQEPSNFRSEGNLDSFLCEKKIPGIYGIDTRELTRLIREHGTMNAMISKTAQLSGEQWAKLKGYKITDAVALSMADVPVCCCDEKNGAKFNIAVWNFGTADRLAATLSQYGCRCKVFGYDASADELLSSNSDGVILSGGPGDPAENAKIIEEIKKLCKKNTPIFAIGLGHQMLAIANGAKTEKLPFGHRGANQAVKEVGTARAFVTVQNHGYTVKADSLSENAVMNYVNVNDGTCEGIEYKDIPALSISFEPIEEIFDKFKSVMEGRCSNASK